MSITDFFKNVFGSNQSKRVVPLHRFDEFTFEEIELIEESLHRSVTARMQLMEQGLVWSEREKERQKYLCLLFEEVSVVTSIERGKRMHF